MFLDKQAFEETIALLSVHAIANTEDKREKVRLAKDLADELFSNYRGMSADEKESAVSNLLEDINNMPSTAYLLN